MTISKLMYVGDEFKTTEVNLFQIELFLTKVDTNMNLLDIKYRNRLL
jgi:hypothetical protein